MLTKSTLIATLSAISIFASMPAAYASVDLTSQDKAVQTEHRGKADSGDRATSEKHKSDRSAHSGLTGGDRSNDKKDHGAKDHSGSRDRSHNSRSGRSAGK